MSKDKTGFIQNIADKTFNSIKQTSNKDIAEGIERIFTKTIDNPISTTAQNGLNKQIAIIEIISLMRALPNKYDIFRKGELEYGIGIQTQMKRWKESKSSSVTADDWIPTGALESLDALQTVSTGAIQRKVRNDYSVIEIKELVRDSNAFRRLIELETSAGLKTKERELREAFRWMFGIDNKYLPADVKVELAKIKALITQNKKVVTTTTDYKSVVNHLKEFTDEYYNNYSNAYNAGLDPTKANKENIYIDGVDTGVKSVDNSAFKDETILIMSTKFRNKLAQELGNTFNPDYWLDFTNRFGMVIEDTFTDENIFYVVDMNTIQMKSMFEEYTNTYYPDKSAFHTITKWKDFYAVNPMLNLISFDFTITAKSKKELKKDN